MRRLSIDLALGAALVAAIAWNWQIRRPEPAPGREFVPNMARSVRSNAFAPNGVFGDGATLRMPVAGTIPRGVVALHYSASRVDARRAGEELENPFRPDDHKARARGAAVYQDFCVPCHAADGKGEGLVVRRGYPRPPSLLRPQARQMKDGEIFHTITYGRGIMPAHGSQIAPDDRWKAVLHVRAIQAAP